MLHKREMGENIQVIKQNTLLNLHELLTRSMIILPKDLPKKNTLLGIPTLDLQQMKEINKLEQITSLSKMAPRILSTPCILQRFLVLEANLDKYLPKLEKRKREQERMREKSGREWRGEESRVILH
jgi:hypothetical protein